ncbi:hypothetical protein BCR44DRAFT_1425751 [Catenaria anguillulae PL171]|uniref:Uncharacterized protein n=1 Tax=Catenaria anguillulae PL171 TaxID=765915 RepID=A0A1Y2HZC4_9FUNG|nr:hypothetical protein BCR44DRAFT_1425751 [Catenaria anguillulae PL171]
MLASPQAHAAATGNVNGGPNPASAVGFQMSTTTTGHTPVAHVHQRRQVHEHKRTLSMSGSWDPNMSPTTATALSTSTEMAGANASSVVGKAIARPVSTPAGVWETKTQRSGERLVEFAPFSACAGRGLFAMDGSLMLVPGPPGSNLSLGADHLSSPVSRSNTGDDESDELMSSVHGNGSLDDPDPLVHARNHRKLEGAAASSSPPTLSSPSSSSPSALLSTTRAQRLLRVRNLFVQAYRPLTQPITAPPLPSPAAIAVSAPSLAAPESRVRMGVSPPPIAAASPAPASSSSGVLQPQPLNAGILGGGGGSGGGWTSSLSSMMAKMAGVPQAPPVTYLNHCFRRHLHDPTEHARRPRRRAPLTSLLPTPPMSAGNHASTSSSATTAAPTGSTPGALTMPPSWRSVHQQQLHRATSPAAGAGASAALSPRPHRGGGGTSGFRDSWFR